MSRLLRPVCGLSRAEFHRAKESTRSFTTTQFFAEEEKTPRPTVEQRSQKTSKELGDLLKRGPRDNGPAPSRGGGGGGGARGGKIVNLQSLSRRGARGGGLGGVFRGLGRGGQRGGQRGGMARPGNSPARGGGGGGRGGGPGARRKKEEDPDAQSDEDYQAFREAKAKKKLDKIPETLEERKARLRRDVGVHSRYNPSTTLASLTPFLPEVPSDTNKLGRLATALTNMRVLTGGYIDDNPVPHGRHLYQKLNRDGVLYFTNLRARTVTEREGEVGAPDETVRNTITKRAVMGEYDSLESPDVKDPMAVVRNGLGKSQTFTGPKVTTFESKLTELIGKGKKGQEKKGQEKKGQEKKAQGKVKA